MPLDPTYSDITEYVDQEMTATQIAAALNADGRHIHNADRLALRQLYDDANILRIDKSFVAVSGLLYDTYLSGMSPENKVLAETLYNELRTEKTLLSTSAPVGGMIITLVNGFAEAVSAQLDIPLAEYQDRIDVLTGGVRWVGVTAQQIQTIINDNNAFEAELPQWWQRVVNEGSLLVESNTPDNPVSRQDVLTAIGAVE